MTSPRDGWPLDPDPLDVTEPDRPILMGVDPAKPGTDHTVFVRRDRDGKLRVLREQHRRRRLGSSSWQLVIAAVWIGVAILILRTCATPRSAIVPTATSPGSIDVRPGSAGPSTPPPGASGGSLSGAPRRPVEAAADEREPDLLSVDAPRPRTEAPVPSLSGVTYQGSLAWARPSHGPLYLALREPRGTRVEVCGSAACLTRTSTDFGPIRSLFEAGRIADVSAADFETLCAMTPEQRLLHGLCPGKVSIISRPRIPMPATDTEANAIAGSGFGMHGAPRLSMSATCRSTGRQAVWVAQTGTAFLDIIQIGTMDGEFFYAYGRGVPLGADSLYVERHLGPSGTGPHRYALSLEARVWTLRIDGRVVATIPDTFRTWRLRATQVMAEGDPPFGEASCSLPAGAWSYGGYGPQPRTEIGATSWRVAL